jgi:hypothetical protein
VAGDWLVRFLGRLEGCIVAGGNWLLLVVHIGLAGGAGRNSGIFCSGRMLEDLKVENEDVCLVLLEDRVGIVIK